VFAGALSATQPKSRCERKIVIAFRIADPDWIRWFQHRVLQDAMTEALPQYWERRARAFNSVHPDEAPLPLFADPETTAAASEAGQCALACQRAAYVIRTYELPGYLIDEIAEVA
jgi:hypothetical protein